MMLRVNITKVVSVTAFNIMAAFLLPSCRLRS